MKGTEYDVIIIGAGPAGLTADIYTARNGLKTLILEEKTPGGLVAEASWIENYPRFREGIAGIELVIQVAEQAKKFNVKIKELESVIGLNLRGKKKRVTTEKKQG
jgi:thioredoxin reductase (NADPH)